MEQVLAYYLRLSDEDMDLKRNKQKDESNSIASQRGLILRYIEKDTELCHMPRSEYCDDGYSGTNFERPSFKKMIESAKKGEIACIVVKDLSRFGRDYLEVGDYLEHIFPFLGIRLISVNDCYDSKNHNGKTIGMDIAFRNLIYDYYSKDLSAKVKTAMRIRQEKGEYISCVLYGYKCSENNKHRMVIDPEAAEIVREIFNAVLEGKSTSEVAAELNERGVPTPQEYKGVHRNNETKPQWTRSRITYMIRNIKYTGVMTNHTRESHHIRDKNLRRVPRDEWIIRENMHEAIIPREIWEKANAMLSTRSNRGRKASVKKDRVFYCAHCGRKLQKSNGQNAYYYCTSAEYHQNSPCGAIHLSKMQIEDTIAAALRVQLAVTEQTSEKTRKTKQEESLDNLQEIRKIEREAETLQKKKLEQYESYREGKIGMEKFRYEKERITSELDDLMAKKSAIEAREQSLSRSQELQKAKEHDAKLAKGIMEAYDAGLREHLYDGIDRIIVTDNSNIEIGWRFPDLFQNR